jgi:hypothetical protein
VRKNFDRQGEDLMKWVAFWLKWPVAVWHIEFVSFLNQNDIYLTVVFILFFFFFNVRSCLEELFSKQEYYVILAPPSRVLVSQHRPSASCLIP